jgi:ATP dependent DNA ligase C terminal region/ATP dependent DNA ligase domain
MSTNGLLDKSRTEIRLGEYRVASATALSDPMLLSRVQEYRRLASSRMYPLDRSDIRHKIPKAHYHVSRKVDGEFTVLIYDSGQVVLLNPGGTVRTGLPVTQEAVRLLSKAKVKQAMIAGELYVQCENRRPRVHDVATVARQPQSEADLKRLRFAPFDIVSLDGNLPGPYAETWKTIERLFGNGELLHPVETRLANGPDDIDECFETWVEKEGAEGLVARSDSAGLFKIKPRHTLDVAVIGFTESVDDREGMMHDLLYAVMRHDGTLQVLSRVGGGFHEEERRTMLSDLKDMIVESEYAEVNSDHVAYQMVRPEWVIEISCLDLISQTTRGAPINRVVLDYQDNGSKGYHVVRRMPLATVISPQFIRRREDKAVLPHDVRIEQVSSVVEVPLWDRDARQMAKPKSEVLRREVYTKVMKGETMVRKLLLWKTNKETDSDEYPAYVLHYTDFSAARKTPLEREVRVSSSREQMDNLWREMLTENIKKGWELHSTAASATSSEVMAALTSDVSPAPPEPTDKPKNDKKKSSKKRSA